MAESIDSADAVYMFDLRERTHSVCLDGLIHLVRSVELFDSPETTELGGSSDLIYLGDLRYFSESVGAVD